MLFAGQNPGIRKIIGWQMSYPPKPIYEGDGMQAFTKPGQSPGDDRSKDPYDKDWPAPAPLAPKLANINGIAPYTDPLSGVLVDGGTDMQNLLRSLGLPDNDIAMGNPSFDIGGGHRGASRNAKIYNKIRANDNLNEIKIIKDMLGGPSLPPF